MSKAEKVLIIHNKENKSIARIFSMLSPNNKTITEKIDSSNAREAIETLCNKLHYNLFISIQTTMKKKQLSVSFGRVLNSELTDFVTYKAVYYKTIEQMGKSPEFVSNFVVVTIGLTERMRYLFLDIFSTGCQKINIENLKYCLVLKEIDDIFYISYCDFTKEMEIVGLNLEMVKTDEFCIDLVESRKGKKNKNIESDGTNKIGKVYVPKQNLKAINLKHTKVYKNDN